MPGIFFPSSLQPSDEAVCTLWRCRISIDFSDGKTLRSLDLSERSRGAESDNEKESWEGETRCSPPPTVMLACSWVSSTGGVACLRGDELLLWPCERGWSLPCHSCCCFSEHGRGSVPGPSALCASRTPHKWLIPPLAAPLSGSTQGPRRLTRP